MKTANRLLVAAFGLAICNVSTGVAQAQSYTNNYGVWGYTTRYGTVTITGFIGPRG